MVSPGAESTNNSMRERGLKPEERAQRIADFEAVEARVKAANGDPSKVLGHQSTAKKTFASTLATVRRSRELGDIEITNRAHIVEKEVIALRDKLLGIKGQGARFDETPLAKVDFTSRSKQETPSAKPPRARPAPKPAPKPLTPQQSALKILNDSSNSASKVCAVLNDQSHPELLRDPAIVEATHTWFVKHIRHAGNNEVGASLQTLNIIGGPRHSDLDAVRNLIHTTITSAFFKSDVGNLYNVLVGELGVHRWNALLPEDLHARTRVVKGCIGADLRLQALHWMNLSGCEPDIAHSIKRDVRSAFILHHIDYLYDFCRNCLSSWSPEAARMMRHDLKNLLDQFKRQQCSDDQKKSFVIAALTQTPEEIALDKRDKIVEKLNSLNRGPGDVLTQLNTADGATHLESKEVRQAALDCIKRQLTQPHLHLSKGDFQPLMDLMKLLNLNPDATVMLLSSYVATRLQSNTYGALASLKQAYDTVLPIVGEATWKKITQVVAVSAHRFVQSFEQHELQHRKEAAHILAVPIDHPFLKPVTRASQPTPSAVVEDEDPLVEGHQFLANLYLEQIRKNIDPTDTAEAIRKFTREILIMPDAESARQLYRVADPLLRAHAYVKDMKLSSAAREARDILGYASLSMANETFDVSPSRQRSIINNLFESCDPFTSESDRQYSLRSLNSLTFAERRFAVDQANKLNNHMYQKWQDGQPRQHFHMAVNLVLRTQDLLENGMNDADSLHTARERYRNTAA